jgi:hypothetical protein
MRVWSTGWHSGGSVALHRFTRRYAVESCRAYFNIIFINQSDGTDALLGWWLRLAASGPCPNCAAGSAEMQRS